MWTPARAQTRKSQDRPVALGLEQPMQCITLVRHRHCHEKIGLRKNIEVNVGQWKRETFTVSQPSHRERSKLRKFKTKNNNFSKFLKSLINSFLNKTSQIHETLDTSSTLESNSKHRSATTFNISQSVVKMSSIGPTRLISGQSFTTCSTVSRSLPHKRHSVLSP